MKIKILAVVLFLQVFNGVHAQQPRKENDAMTYLIGHVLLLDRDSGSVVILPHSAANIKAYEPDTVSRYWLLLEKYFPGVSMDSLRKKVDAAAWIDKTMKVPPYKLYFPDIQENDGYNFREIYRQYQYHPVFSVSNVIYAHNGTVCIVYVTGYQAGMFTVEIKKDRSGKWASYNVFTDVLD